MLDYMAASLLLLNTFRFEGGDAGDLSQVLSVELNRPVAIFADSVNTFYSKCEIDWVSLEELRAKAKNVLKLHTKTRGTFGGSHGAWPPSFFRLNDRIEYMAAFQNRPGTLRTSSSDGTVEISTSRPMRAIDVLKTKSPRSVELHWFFRDAFIGVHASRAKEDEVFKTIADCLGASLKLEEKTVRIEIDPVEHRLRTLAMLRSELRTVSSPVLIADLTYAYEVYSALSKAQWIALYKSPSTELAFPISPALQPLAHRRLESRFGARSDPALGRLSSATATRKWIEDNVDFSGPSWAVVSANGLVMTKLSQKKPKAYFTF